MLEQDITIHACLVEIDGCGVLIVGDSGVGKTTLCLELARRGHPFIADDAVVIQTVDGTLSGRAAAETANIAMIRGEGIVPIPGVTNAECVSQVIGLVAGFSEDVALDVLKRIGFKGIPTHIIDGQNLERAACELINVTRAQHSNAKYR